eukprot:363416-Rhodomonas_salina.3
MDMSFMSKFRVRGDGSGAMLNWLSTANVDSAVNRITYTQWLNEAGTLEADLTVIKLGADDFMVVASDNTRRHVEGWMRRHVPTDGASAISIQDVTAAYGQINVQGPLSRALLEKVVDVPLDDASFRLPLLTRLVISPNIARSRHWTPTANCCPRFSNSAAVPRKGQHAHVLMPACARQVPGRQVGRDRVQQGDVRPDHVPRRVRVRAVHADRTGRAGVRGCDGRRRGARAETRRSEVSGVAAVGKRVSRLRTRPRQHRPDLADGAGLHVRLCETRLLPRRRSDPPAQDAADRRPRDGAAGSDAAAVQRAVPGS